jgi:cyanophycinase-like exopeptidase
MIYLYSAFSKDFAKNLALFTQAIPAGGRVALLIQGGEGHEKFLASYLGPLRENGVTAVDVITPDYHTKQLGADSLQKIRQAGALFIGGGDTLVYQQIYCNPAVKSLLQEKHASGTPIAGLSAGAKLLCGQFYEWKKKLLHEGLGLVAKLVLFPHFEEDPNAYQFVRFALHHPESPACGLEANALLLVAPDGGLTRAGNGAVYYSQTQADGAAIIRKM